MRRVLPVLAACETVLLAGLVWLAILRGTPSVEAAPPEVGPEPAVAASNGPAALPVVADRTPLPAASPASAQSGGGMSVVVHGFVTDRAGKPLEGAQVSYSRTGGGAARSGYSSRGKPYVLAGLAPGRWQLRVRADGHRGLDREVDVVALPRVQRLDHVLDELVVLSVRVVTPDGKPLLPGLPAGARQVSRALCAIATADPPVAALPLTTSGTLTGYGVGQWRVAMERAMRNQPALAPEVAGQLELSEPLPLYVSLVLRSVLVETQLVASGRREVTFTLPAERLTGLFGSLRVRVLDAATHQPLLGARVSATDTQSGSSGVEVDAEGRCRLDGLMPGLLELDARAVDHEWLHRWVEIEPGQCLDAGTLELGSPRKVAGRVLGADGKPFTGVEVRVACVRLDDYAAKLDLRRFDRTCDAKGEFTLEQLGRGRYLVSVAVKAARHAWQVIDTTAGDVSGLELRLGAVQPVTVRCAKPTSELLTLVVRDGKGQPIANRRPVSASLPMTLELPIGRYELEVWDGRRQRARVAFTVGEGANEVRYEP